MQQGTAYDILHTLELSVVGGMIRDHSMVRPVSEVLNATDIEDEAAQKVFIELVKLDDAADGAEFGHDAAMCAFGQKGLTADEIELMISSAPAVSQTVGNARILADKREWERNLSMIDGIRFAKDTDELVEMLQVATETITDSRNYKAISTPKIVPFADISGQNERPQKPELINGILRRGHKMIVQGQSKLGKTLLLMQLAVSIATGQRWMTHDVMQGNVLYCDFEIDLPEHRFMPIIKALGADMETVQQNLSVWSLRGCQVTLDTFVSDLLAQVDYEEYAAIIIDPIYKLMDGDENKAGDVAKMVGAFDKVARDTGAAVIYCHHHSKGGQAGKNAIDRSSGSGVFGRDADAVLDLLELEVSSSVRDELGLAEDDRITGIKYEWIVREFDTPRVGTGYLRYPLHHADIHGYLEQARTAAEARKYDANERNKATRNTAEEDLIVVFDYMFEHNQARYKNGIEREALRKAYANQRKRSCNDRTLSNVISKAGLKSKTDRETGKKYVYFPDDEEVAAAG